MLKKAAVSSPNNKAFYENVKSIIESLIDHCRLELKLNIFKDDMGKIVDPMATHEFGKHLINTRLDIMGAFTRNGDCIRSRFNFESLTTLLNLMQQKKYSGVIQHGINELNEVILTDIQTPEPTGGNFYYQNISSDSVAELINLLCQNNDKIPAGEMLWRVCIGLKRDQVPKFFKKHSSLIGEIRQLVSYQKYKLFDEKNNPRSHGLILDDPWLLAFFTWSQLADFLNTPVTQQNKVHETVQSLMTLVDRDVDKGAPKKSEASPMDSCFFASAQNITTDQKFLRTTLLRFITCPENRTYSASVVNASMSENNFIWNCGLYKEFLSLTEPMVIVDLYLHMEWTILFKRVSEDDTPKDAHDLRKFTEYRWLHERIIQDLNTGESDYFAKVTSIPYILYYLVGIPEFYKKISRDKLVAFFRHIDSKNILQTLGLFDEHDESKPHCFLKINNNDYKVNKEFCDQIYKQLAELLLSDDFLPLRKHWMQTDSFHQLFIHFPFLLKGLDSNTIKDFIDRHKFLLVANAKKCRANKLNPFLICPLLLQHLDVKDIVDLYKTDGEVRQLFETLSLPPDVIIGYIKQGKIEELIKEIPSLRNCLTPAYFKQVNRSLFDEALLSAMVNFEKNPRLTRQLLINHPSILDMFSKQIIATCGQAEGAVFLRQILRQKVLIDLILEYFNDLRTGKDLLFISDIVDNFLLMKSMLKVLYKNPETELIAASFEQELQTWRNTLPEHYDVRTQSRLVELADRKLNFVSTPYSHLAIFPEQRNLTEVEAILEEVSEKMSTEQVDPVNYLLTKKIDPIIYLINNMILTHSSWARRFIQSSGFYPALKQYCFQILHKSVDKLQENDDHYAAIYLYAILKIEEGEYEEAAEYLEEYIEYLGIGINNNSQNHNQQSSQNSAFYLLLRCANKLSESKPCQALDYYHYLATALLATSQIVFHSDSSLTKEKRISLAKKNIHIRSFWHEMVLSLATVSYDLIQKDLLQEKRLGLIACIHELLLQAITSGNCADDACVRATFLKDQFITAGIDHLKITFAELCEKLTQSMAFIAVSYLKRYSLKESLVLIEGQTGKNDDDNVKALLKFHIATYTLKQNYEMSKFMKLVMQRILIHEEINNKGIATAIKLRVDKEVKVDAQPKVTTLITQDRRRISFSPYSRSKEENERKRLFANVVLNLPKTMYRKTLKIGVAKRLGLSAEQANELKKAANDEVTRRKTAEQELRQEMAKYAVKPLYTDGKAIDEKLKRKAEKKAKKKQAAEEAERKEAEDQAKQKREGEETRKQQAGEEAKKKQTEDEAKKQPDQDEKEKERLEEQKINRLLDVIQEQKEEIANDLRLQEEQKEKQKLADDLESAKERERQRQSFFKKQDEKKQKEQEEAARMRQRHVRRSSTGSLKAIALSKATGKSFVDSIDLQDNNVNVIGPNAPIKRTPSASELSFVVTPEKTDSGNNKSGKNSIASGTYRNQLFSPPTPAVRSASFVQISRSGSKSSESPLAPPFTASVPKK